MQCPTCKEELAGRKYRYQCKACGDEFKVEFECEVCGGTPEVLAGCGSVSFYCSTCRTVKSRESMNKRFTPGV